MLKVPFHSLWWKCVLIIMMYELKIQCKGVIVALMKQRWPLLQGGLFIFEQPIRFRKERQHSSNQSQKTLENSIDSMIVRLIRSIENQSSGCILLNSIDSAANRTSIAFDWLPLAGILYLEKPTENSGALLKLFYCQRKRIILIEDYKTYMTTKPIKFI